MTNPNTKSYEVTHENEVIREPGKARYDVETIRKIIAESHFVNVSFVDIDGNPQCIPMVSAVIEEPDGGLSVYLHGYHKARLVKLLPPETRVCITATLLDGVVLALSAFHHSMNHRSAVLHGEVLPWDNGDEDEETKKQVKEAKWEAARQIVESVLPGRWENSRQPNAGEMATTGFVKVKVLSASAKCRTGDPGEEKKDTEDEALTNKTWAGVIPTRLAYGTPEPSAINRMKEVPDYIKQYIGGKSAPSN